MAHPMEHPPWHSVTSPFARGKHKSYIKHHKSNIMEKNNIWSKILKIVITVLTAVATTFGLQACGAL